MMNRKFKLAGVLMAIACLFAVTASLASATFTSEKYPAEGSGATTADVLDAFGSSATCKDNTFQIGPLNEASTQLTIEPDYTSCTAFGLTATVNITGCDVLAHNGSGKSTVAVDLVCPVGVKGIDITAYTSPQHTTAICHAVLTPFTGKEGLTASNNGSHVLVQGTVSNLNVHQTRTSFLCPAGTETKEAKYTVQAAGTTIVGTNGAISLS